MAEYIEREAYMAELVKGTIITDDLYGVGIMSGLDYAMKKLKEQPAADVSPVVHAKWIPCDPDSDVRFYCSECGTEISTSWDYDCDEMWNGCPHCLARMDGE